MNYRHAFHAGNFADVLKHTVLSLALHRMTEKPRPLRVIDTHAGIGSYRLDSPEALRTGEWRNGIGRLLGPEAAPLPVLIEDLLHPYLEAVRRADPAGRLEVYPGSPSLALSLIRPDDRLVASELHPDDVAALRAALRLDSRAKVLEMDGWQALRALLPPKERRGLVLVDPPFEDAGELERLIDGLVDGLRRFATGTFLLWLPVKSHRQTESLAMALRRMKLAKLLWIEMRTESIDLAQGLKGSALAVVNPPFGLEDRLTALLPFLTQRLATGGGAAWRLGGIADGLPPLQPAMTAD
jgi:23S rRNA (adenine2030-N6)-methyltransferase